MRVPRSLDHRFAAGHGRDRRSCPARRSRRICSAGNRESLAGSDEGAAQPIRPLDGSDGRVVALRDRREVLAAPDDVGHRFAAGHGRGRRSCPARRSRRICSAGNRESLAGSDEGAAQPIRPLDGSDDRVVALRDRREILAALDDVGHAFAGGICRRSVPRKLEGGLSLARASRRASLPRRVGSDRRHGECTHHAEQSNVSEQPDLGH